MQYCRLYTVHVMPTAWDWKIGDMTEQWVLVTLKDGTRFAGLCGSDSFISSDPPSVISTFRRFTTLKKSMSEPRAVTMVYSSLPARSKR